MSAVEAAVEPVCIQQNGHWQAYTVTNFDAARNNYLTYAGPVQHQVAQDPNWCQQNYGVKHLPHVGAGADWFIFGLALIGGLCAGIAITIIHSLRKTNKWRD
jgi:hypothetical protein